MHSRKRTGEDRPLIDFRHAVGDADGGRRIQKGGHPKVPAQLSFVVLLRHSAALLAAWSTSTLGLIVAEMAILRR